MCSEQIRDGTGTGSLTKVDGTNRLHVKGTRLTTKEYARTSAG